MASEYTLNRRYPLYTDQDKPNLRDQYNGAVREIDVDMQTALTDSSNAADGVSSINDKLGSGFSSSSTVAQQLAAVRTTADAAATSAALQAEVQARTDADTDINGRIGSGFSSSSTVAQQLAAVRTTADAAATSAALQAEVQARTDSDTDINGRIGSGFSSSSTVAQQLAAVKTTADNAATSTALQSETSARQSADTALSNRITALESTGKLILFGDSWVTGDNNNWPSALANELGLTLVNYAHGGMGWYYEASDHQNVLQQVSAATADNAAKYVIMIAGVNDVRNGISYNNSKNNMVSAINSAKTKFPAAKILVCPINVPKSGYVNGSIDVCDTIFNDYYFNSFVDVGLNGVATFDLLPWLQPLAHVNTFTGDGLHPSSYGNSLILSAIKNAICGNVGAMITKRSINAASGFTMYGNTIQIVDGVCYFPSLLFTSHEYTQGTATTVATVASPGSAGVNLPWYKQRNTQGIFTFAHNGGIYRGSVELSLGTGEIKFTAGSAYTGNLYFTIPPFHIAGA